MNVLLVRGLPALLARLVLHQEGNVSKQMRVLILNIVRAAVIRTIVRAMCVSTDFIHPRMESNVSLWTAAQMCSIARPVTINPQIHARHVPTI